MKKKVRIFISYAHKNKALAADLRSRLDDHLHASARYDYVIWQDVDIMTGDDWQAKIRQAITKCDMGILLVSPALLGSAYVVEKELPLLLKSGKPVLPVALYPIDFARYDLHGLARLQFYFLDDPRFSQPRSYQELRGRRRDDFTFGLFKMIEDILSN